QGCDLAVIFLPLTKEYLAWCMANSLALQNAMTDYLGEVQIHLPSHKLFMTSQDVAVIQQTCCQSTPVTGPTIFTDGLGKTGKAATVWQEEGQWKDEVHEVQGWPQIVELSAVFKKWKELLNLVTDSCYVCGVVQCLEKSWSKHLDNERLFNLFKPLWIELTFRQNDFYVLHVCSHTLPGFIREGNARANHLTSPAWAALLLHKLKQVQLSHKFFHQSAKALRKQFGLSWSEAQDIVKMC
ncbi:POK8 protein, partial [Podilymbus podiceps]|nr:POK8 protein [Podilymbus podiceps]